MTLPRLMLLVSVFFLMMTVVEAIPTLVAIFQERFKAGEGKTARELSKFFITIRPGKIIIVICVLGVVVGILAGSWVLGAALCLLGTLAPKFLLSIWKSIRSAQVDAQLMDGLILMGNTLKSGLDIVAGVERIATNMPPPISEEFGLVLNSYRLGTPLETALMDMTRRIRSRNLETVIYAINIQRETGGNIIKTFDQLVTTIREETKLQKKVKAITAQGRTQIVFLAVFPWLLGVMFLFIAPDFMKPALASTWGQITVLVLILWEIIGVIVTQKLVAVDE